MKLKSLALATAAAMIAVPAIAEDLVLSIGSRGYGPAVERNLARYAEANPDINIEWNKVSDVPGETRKLYVTGLTAKSPTPDVYALDVIWAGEFAQRGWLEPLNGLLSDETIATFNPSLLSASTVDGEVHALPLYADGIHFFYRTDLLEKYGLDVPQTWEEVLAASEVIADGEKNPQFYGFVSMWAKIEGLFMNWLAFVNGNGGGMFDADGNLAVNQPANIEATQFMVDLLNEHRAAPDSILNMKPDDARTLFQQGRAAFLMVQDFVYAPLSADDSPVADKFDFTRVPYFEGHADANSTTMGGWFLGINPNSENKETAAKFLEFFTAYDQQLAAAIDDNRAPTIPAVYENPDMAGAEVLAKFGSNYDFGVVRPSAETGSKYPKVSEIMQLEITNALHQQKTVEEALNDAQTQIEAVLAE
ncbi:ABC transporter substrate-binding protein [Tropicimonas sp. IMCC6043]|uniref:ABC transporter substrate-binding protein n=1 Tax=Tropicimonas sp. IMCC6043 TaxID=2510645 RepID=UPI00101D1E83|nr:ABC transporter substrate-binding protein [Tropicimonas sp. IMCC6043]RYH11374.1 ABC transporter substrate-binding protein [Tropicimonas sp. IMCC6043]